MNNIINALRLSILYHNSSVDYRLSRIWSNNELRKISSLFSGTVLNVSAESDKTKEGGCYRDMFSSCDKYLISNCGDGKSGLKIDLESTLDENYFGIADVVFNHTTLEHIFDIQTAFKNLSLLTKDVLICVVPFIQKLHGGKYYNDFWRFTPEAMMHLYTQNGMTMQICTDNYTQYASTYLFCVGYKNNKWDDILPKCLYNIMSATDDDIKRIGAINSNTFIRRFFYFYNVLNKKNLQNT